MITGGLVSTQGVSQAGARSRTKLVDAQPMRTWEIARTMTWLNEALPLISQFSTGSFKNKVDADCISHRNIASCGMRSRCNR
jgi:hypothetical protein